MLVEGKEREREGEREGRRDIGRRECPVEGRQKKNERRRSDFWVAGNRTGTIAHFNEPSCQLGLAEEEEEEEHHVRTTRRSRM